MCIEEIKIAKDKMEYDIRAAVYDAVAKFRLTTGVNISSIDIPLYEAVTFPGKTQYVLGEVNTTVEIF